MYSDFSTDLDPFYALYGFLLIPLQSNEVFRISTFFVLSITEET
jgi:hypothetical protein